MIDDLVRRLLDIAGDTNEENETLHEAADRIEKLEAALSDIIVLSDDYDKAVPIARKALEGNDD